MNTKQYEMYYKETPWFKYTNPNPTAAKKRTLVWDKCDCSVRALANATGISWIMSFDFLSAKARRDFNVPNDTVMFRQWMVENGAVWTACKAEKGKSRMKCLDFAKSHPSGRYIIAIANHWCACVDGVILDVWNTSDSAVVGYMDMTNFNSNI